MRRAIVRMRHRPWPLADTMHVCRCGLSRLHNRTTRMALGPHLRQPCAARHPCAIPPQHTSSTPLHVRAPPPAANDGGAVPRMRARRPRPGVVVASQHGSGTTALLSRPPKPLLCHCAASTSRARNQLPHAVAAPLPIRRAPPWRAHTAHTAIDVPECVRARAPQHAMRVRRWPAGDYPRTRQPPPRPRPRPPPVALHNGAAAACGYIVAAVAATAPPAAAGLCGYCISGGTCGRLPSVDCMMHCC